MCLRRRKDSTKIYRFSLTFLAYSAYSACFGMPRRLFMNPKSIAIKFSSEDMFESETIFFCHDVKWVGSMCSSLKIGRFVFV